MDHARLVDQRLDRGNGGIEQIVPASDLHRVATASRAIFAPGRNVARAMLQAKITREAHQLPSMAIGPWCPERRARYLPTRTVSPQTVLGEGHIPGRTCPCRGGGASFRPDDRSLGVLEVGDRPDDVRARYPPVVAEWPQRVAHALLERCTGVVLRSCGAQGRIDRTAQARQPWEAARDRQEAVAVVDAWGGVGSAPDLRVESARDGVMAHIAGRGQEAQGGTLLGRRLEAQAEEPTLGAIVGDGAHGMWPLANVPCPGVRQTLEYDHRREPLEAFANLQAPNDLAGAKAGVDQTMGALLLDRGGKVLSALQRLRPWTQAVRTALAPLVGSVERNRTRIRSQERWQGGLAGGAGAVEGACTHVIQRQFKRAGMRWKSPGGLTVVALRMARRQGTFQAFWTSRGLVIQLSV